jgi:hypothetical protein
LRVLGLREAAVQPQRLADLARDGVHRVQRRHRLLEDHADAVAANLAHGVLVAPDQFGVRRSGCCP